MSHPQPIPQLPFIHLTNGARLHASNLRLTGRGILLEQGFSAAFVPGEIYYITAPNGAGKSSVLACLAGLLHPDSGTVEIRQENHPLSTTKKSALISWLPPEDDFVIPQSAIDIVLAGRWRFHLGRPSQQDRKIALQCLEMLEVETIFNKNSTTLSSGQKRRVNLARVIAQDAAIILLDEPFRGLDVQARRLCQRAFVALKSLGRTIIIADPNPPLE